MIGALQTLLRGASRHDGPWPVISIWHGSADHTVAISNVDRMLAQWQGVHQVTVSPTVTKSASGHERRSWRDSTARRSSRRTSSRGWVMVLRSIREPSMARNRRPVSCSTSESRSDAADRELLGAWCRRWVSTSRDHTRRRKLRRATRRSDPSSPGGRVDPDPRRKPHAKSTSGIAKVIVEDALRAAGLMS